MDAFRPYDDLPAASSPESTNSYVFSVPEEYSALGNVVKEILDSKAAEHEVQNLCAQARKHLTIFDNPLYSSLDTPEWVRHALEHAYGPLRPTFRQLTVRKLLKAMCDTAEDLGLESGKRYVTAAICTCAIRTGKAEQKELELAQHLQRLTSIWAAFLLWPIFAQQCDAILPVEDGSSCATPTQTGTTENRNGTLRDRVLQRDEYRCVLSGALERSVYEQRKAHNRPIQARLAESLEVCHIFKRSAAVYSSSSDKTSDKDKIRSAAVTFKLLRRYCELDLKYLDDKRLMHKPENAILLIPHFHKTFDSFLWCLKPTETPNRYEVKEYDPASTFMYIFSVPSHVTFKSDHTIEDSDDSEAAPEVGISEPDATRRDLRSLKHPPRATVPHPELLRLHAVMTGVLQMSDAANVFELIVDRRWAPGNPPVPGANGAAFMKEVVDPEMWELRESVAALCSPVSQ